MDSLSTLDVLSIVGGVVATFTGLLALVFHLTHRKTRVVEKELTVEDIVVVK